MKPSSIIEGSPPGGPLGFLFAGLVTEMTAHIKDPEVKAQQQIALVHSMASVILPPTFEKSSMPLEPARKKSFFSRLLR